MRLKSAFLVVAICLLPFTSSDAFSQTWRFDEYRKIPTVWFHDLKVVNYGVPAYFSGRIECRYPLISLRYDTPVPLQDAVFKTMQQMTAASRFWVRVDSNTIQPIDLEMDPLTTVPTFNSWVSDDVLGELAEAKLTITLSGTYEVGGFDYQLLRASGALKAISSMASACISNKN